MADVFQEVEEGLRQDKYQIWLRKYGPWALGALALVVAAVGFNEWRSARQTSESDRDSEAYAQALEALEEGRPAEAKLAFETLAERGVGGYPALATLMAGAAALENGDVQGAAALFEEAADLAGDPVLEDLARLKAAYALADELDRSELDIRIGALAQTGRPFQYAALELLAAAALRDGDLRQAREDYTVLSLAPQAPPGVSRRAQEALALIRAQEPAAAPAPAPADEPAEEPQEETAG